MTENPLLLSWSSIRVSKKELRRIRRGARRNLLQNELEQRSKIAARKWTPHLDLSSSCLACELMRVHQLIEFFKPLQLYPSYCRPCLNKFLSSCKHERNDYIRKCFQCNSLLYELFSLHDCAEQARNNPDPWVSLGYCLSTFVTRQEFLAPTQSSGDKLPRFELLYVLTKVQHNKNNSTQIEETVEWVRDSGGSKVDEIRCFVLKNSEDRNTFERANTNFDWDVVLGVSVWNRPSQMF